MDIAKHRLFSDKDGGAVLVDGETGALWVSWSLQRKKRDEQDAKLKYHQSGPKE